MNMRMSMTSIIITRTRRTILPGSLMRIGIGMRRYNTLTRISRICTISIGIEKIGTQTL